MIHMNRRMRKKLDTVRGFTLAETLLAVLIMLLVSTIVVAGIPAAKSAYENVVLASNAEVLLSTTISALRNELGTSEIIDTPSGNINITYTDGDITKSVTASKAIIYYNENRSSFSVLFKDESDSKSVQLARYIGYDPVKKEISSGGLGVNSKPERLISKAAATNDLYVTYDSVTYNKETRIVTFSNLSVNHGETTGLASRDNFSIRVISK